MTGKRQAEYPCTECGSYYRNNNNCNICDSHQPVDEEFYKLKRFSKKEKLPRGCGWDKKKHKVIWRS